MSKEISVEVEKQIAVVRIENGRRNPITYGMWGEIQEAFDRLGEDNDLRAVVLYGANGDFSAGSNISEFDEAAKSKKAARDFWLRVNSATKAVEDCMHPVIAAVDGFALGASMDLANAADVVIATEESKWGVPAAKIGVTYGYYATERLKDAVGSKYAEWILIQGQIFNAVRAEKIGLVSLDLVTPGDLISTAMKEANRHVVEFAPLAVRQSKEYVVRSRRARIPYGADNELPMWGQSADMEEGRSAFLEKRAPRFQAR